MQDPADKLFDAISVLVNKKINSMRFDETKKALIINADQAEKGIYTVTEDSVYSYQAYTTVTDYKVNDTVLVTIPQGNYDNQKMIIGKSVVDTGTPIVYTSPFATIVDISNNIITNDLGMIELYANGSNYVWPNGLTDFPKEFDNSNSNTSINNLLEENENPWNKYKMQCVWQSPSGLNLNGYTRIGLQAQIATYLGEYNTILGNYGLALEVTFKSLELTEGANTFSNCIIFDSDEFFGDVYRFDTYYTQEAVYDISDFLQFPIDQFKLYVYQRHNFIDKYGVDVPAPEEDDFSNIGPNIIFKDFYLCVGEEKDKFKNDTAKLICNNDNYYYKDIPKHAGKEYNEENSVLRAKHNLKEIELVWLHKEITSGVIRRVEANDLPRDYHIYWYRYKLGAPSPDIFAGPMWERFYGCKDVDIDGPEADLDYCITIDEYLEDNSRDTATDTIFINFVPNINRGSEQIKAVILHEEENGVLRFIAATEPMEFLNKDEVRNETSVIDLNILAIRAEDDQQGKYFIYNRADNLEENDANLIRTLLAVFDPTPVLKDKAVLTEYQRIKWTFPTENTMIIPAASTEPGAETLTTNIITGTNRVGYYIKKHLDRSASNNTIQLEVFRDGQTYSADITLLFGTAGTSGSDYTVVLTWQNQTDRALDVTKPGWHSLKGEVGLYDNKAGNFIDFPEDTVINYEWAVSDITPIYFLTEDYTAQPNKEYFRKDGNNYNKVSVENGEDISGLNYYETNSYGFKYDDRDLFYPIFSNINDITFEPTGINEDIFLTSHQSRISDEKSYGGYYYYYDSKYNDVCEELHKIFTANFSYSFEHGFQQTGTIIKKESVISSLAYFNLNEKKYKLLSECSMFSVQEDNGYGFLEDNGYRIDWLYRKRKNNTGLTKLVSVNKDETFFKLIFDTYFKLDNSLDIYTFILNNQYWQKDSSEFIFSPRLKDAISQYPEDDIITVELKNEYLNSTYDNNNSNTIINNLKIWINDKKDSINNEKLFKFIFTNANIYETILKNNFTNGITFQNKYSTSSKLSKYVYYDFNSNDNFKLIFNSISNRSVLIDILEKYVFSNTVIYDFANVDNLSNIEYEFNKPEIEFLPLLISDTTYQIASGDLSEDAIKNTLQSFNVNYVPVIKKNNNNYYNDLYYLFYEENANGINAKTVLDTDFANLKAKDEIFGIDEKVTITPFTDINYYNIFGYSSWDDVWANVYNNNQSDIFAIVDFYYKVMSSSSVTDTQKTNFTKYMYNTFIRDTRSAVLDYYLLTYTENPVLNTMDSSYKEYLDLSEVDIENNKEFIYTTVYNQFKKYLNDKDKKIKDYYNILNTSILQEFIGECVIINKVNFIKDIYNYFTHNNETNTLPNILDESDNIYEELINLWFIQTDKGTYQDTIFKPLNALDPTNFVWVLKEETESGIITTPIAEMFQKCQYNGKTLYSCFMEIYNNESNTEANLFIQGNSLNAFNDVFIICLADQEILNTTDGMTYTFEPWFQVNQNKKQIIENYVKGQVFESILNVTDPEEQYNNYNLYFQNYTNKLNSSLNETFQLNDGSNYKISDLYYETSFNNTYKQLQPLFQETVNKYDSSNIINSSYSALYDLYNTLNNSNLKKIVKTIDKYFLQILFKKLFNDIENDISAADLLKILIEEVLSNNYSFKIKNNNHYVYNSNSGQLTRLYLDSYDGNNFDNNYIFRYDDNILLNAINNNNSDLTNVSNIYYNYESITSDTYARITSAQLNFGDSNFRTIMKDQNLKDALYTNLFSMPYDVSLTVNYMLKYDASAGPRYGTIITPLGTKYLWDWLIDENNYLNFYDYNGNQNIFPGTKLKTEDLIFYSITGYNNNYNSQFDYVIQNIYYYLLYIRCINNFSQNKNDFNILSEQSLIILEDNDDEDIYKNILNEFTILDKNRNSTSLSFVSNYILNNFYYKNNTRHTESDNLFYYDLITPTIPDEYYQISYAFNENYQFALLYYILLKEREFTETDLFTSLFNNSTLFWDYFYLNNKINGSESVIDYLLDEEKQHDIKGIDLEKDGEQFDYSLANASPPYCLNNDDSPSITHYLAINIQNILKTSFQKFSNESEATREARDKYQKNNIYSFLSNFYNNLGSNIKIKSTYNTESSTHSTLYKDLAQFLLTNTYLEQSHILDYTNSEIKTLLYNLIINHQDFLTINSTDNLDNIFKLKFFLNTSEKKLYNIKYEINSILSPADLFNFLKTYQTYFNDYNYDYIKLNLITSLNISEFKEEIAKYFTIPAAVNSLSNIFTNLIVEAKNITDKFHVKMKQKTDVTYSYKVYFDNKVTDLTDYINKNEYISFNTLYNLYLTEFKINNIFQTSNEADTFIKDSLKESKTFNYYNKNNQKAFINVDGHYIIDPYDKWHEGEIYYEPVQIIQKSSCVQPLRYLISSTNIDADSKYPNNLIEIYPDSSLTTSQLMNSLSILKVTISNFGDYDLIINEPIPLRNNTVVRDESGQILSEYRYIDGATYVRYSSGGTMDYDNTPYELYKRTYDEVSKEILIKQVETTDINLKLLIPSESQTIQTDNTNFIPRIENKVLKPAPVYIPNLGAYGVQFIQDGQVVWTQPINVFEDNYPSSTLNAWNGRDIKTDDETGTILTSAISAGKKERDNTFTGIMMGDWSRTDTDSFITKQTGLYGFYHGSMSYAFTDDGRGFIGRDGRGRIYFDGNNSTIYSSEWKGNQQLGMFLDVDDGVIKLHAQNVALDTGHQMQYITLSAKESRYPLAIGYDEYPSKRTFRVNWDGKTFLEDAEVHGKIEAEEGYLKNLQVLGTLDCSSGLIEGGTINGGTINGGTINGTSINGSLLTGAYGNIGGWAILDSGIFSKDGHVMLYNSDLGMVADKLTIKTAVINNWNELAKNKNAKPVVSNNTVIGEIGLITGDNETKTTNLLGIKSITAEGIAIESGKNIRLSGIGSGNLANAIYLQAKEITFKCDAKNQIGIYARFA